MSTALEPLAPSLFDLEQDLQAFLDSEDLVTDEHRKEFETELAESLKASVAKRDRVGQFLAHCSMQQENSEREISRLRARKESFERAEKRVKMYVQAVIESLGRDAKGKYKKLEGNLVTFSLRKAPGHIEVTDEEKVPIDLKNIEVSVPLKTWEELAALHYIDPDLGGKVSIDKREAKRRIDSGEDIPGLDLTIGGHYLEVK